MSLSWSICSLRFINLNNASFEVPTRHELGLDRKLLCGELHSFTCQRLIDTLDLVKHTSRLYDRYPVIRSAFARTHTSFRRLLRDRLVGEHPDPDLSTAFDVTRHRDTSGFDLTIGDPSCFQRLQSVVTKVQVLAARC